MLARGDYAWNGGIFLFRADRFLEELGQHAPEMLVAAEKAMRAAKHDGKRISRMKRSSRPARRTRSTMR